MPLDAAVEQFLNREAFSFFLEGHYDFIDAHAFGQLAEPGIILLVQHGGVVISKCVF